MWRRLFFVGEAAPVAVVSGDGGDEGDDGRLGARESPARSPMGMPARPEVVVVHGNVEWRRRGALAGLEEEAWEMEGKNGSGYGLGRRGETLILQVRELQQPPCLPSRGYGVGDGVW